MVSGAQSHCPRRALTGLATVLNYLFGWPVGTASLLMNIPLFLIGYRSMGRTFAVRSLGATVIFSLLIDFLPLQPMTHDPLLGSLFGGVLLGVGLGFVLKGGATTGGTDMAARVIHQRIPYLSVGVILFIIDCLVVLLAGFQIQAEYALYAFICLYSSSKLIDVVMNGLTTEKACFINSLHGEGDQTGSDGRDRPGRDHAGRQGRVQRAGASRGALCGQRAGVGAAEEHRSSDGPAGVCVYQRRA